MIPLERGRYDSQKGMNSIVGSQNSSIVKGLIEEVKAYLPLLRSGIDALRCDPESAGDIQELHRLVHIVHGAASLVGLIGLSLTAAQLEETLEEVMAGSLPVGAPLLDAMVQTVGWFEAYTSGEVISRDQEEAIVTHAMMVFRRIRALPEAGDEAVLKALLDALGEAEELCDVLLPMGENPFEAETEVLTPTNEARCVLSEIQKSDGGLLFSMDDEVAVSDPFSFDSMPFPGGEIVDVDSPSLVAPEIIEVFYEEVEEHFESMNRILEALEQEVTRVLPMEEAAKESVRQIRRAVHTIKGASSLVGMTGLPAWAHSVEDLLDWLYEDATEIGPEVVAALIKSTDIMEAYISAPSQVEPEVMERLRQAFERISGAPCTQGLTSVSVAGGTEETSGIFDSLRVEEESGAEGGLPRRTGTFRVGMEKLDELVNLASEQIIALSAFDQKMDAFLNIVGELDLTRDRLRETSRNLEVGYEVKAIQNPKGTQYGHGGDAFSDFDSLELDRYSEFNLMIRGLAESVVDIGELHSGMQMFHSEFEGYITRQRVLLGELQGKLMQVRMAPMTMITTRMRRAVREVADKLGKRVRLTIRGEGIELDRVIWEKLADPLLHILRNAVDHGIEEPQVRRMLGKPETGVIVVTASREGNQVRVRIRDDGAGLNLLAIRRQAVSMLGEAAATMGDEALVGLVFTPGFSTREAVTEISGRGVGMDVVKTNIEELNGSVRLSSPEAGTGMVITVHIPLTLAVSRAILCTAGGQTFAVPLNDISDILRVYPENMIFEPMTSVRVGDEVFPLYHLSRALGMPMAASGLFEAGERPIVLKIKSRDRTVAFAVDSLLGQREIVIKSLGSHLQYVKGISGATVMGDGSVVPILNVNDLISPDMGGFPSPLPAEMPRRLPAEEASGEAPLHILVVDDSVSVRQVVTRLLVAQGWQVTTARDGLEALEQLAVITPDLIALDVEMPRMNGYEFLSARRSSVSHQGIPVIMLTSRSTGKYREKARGLGADGYVVKPFNDREFLTLIRSLTVA